MRYEELLEKDTFTVWTPQVVNTDLVKSADGTVQRRIGGIASTQSRDRQSEILISKGLDFSEFVEHGYFNDNHRQDTDALIGIPEIAKFTPGKGWYTEGYLIPEWPLADRIWGLAKSLSKTSRRLGFSVEGKVLERGPDKKILKAIIRNVAITNRPVNTDCLWSALSKAFATDEEISECYDSTTGKTCACSAPNAITKKAMSAGYQSPIMAGGSVLRQEALEGDSDDSSEGLRRETFDPRTLTFRRRPSMKKGIDFLRRVRPGLDDSTYLRIYKFAQQREV